MEYMGRLDGKTLVHCLVQDGFFAAKNERFAIPALRRRYSVPATGFIVGLLWAA